LNFWVNIQATIPHEIFGRVTSSIRLLTVGAMSLGAAVTGVFLQIIGAKFTILVFAIYLLLLALVTSVNRGVRKVGSTSEAEGALKQEMVS
jgi:membrane protein implicated in regulation of membrane protease activity